MKGNFIVVKKYFFFICLLAIISNCFFQKSYYILDEGGIRPKKCNFKLANEPYLLEDTTLLDTAAIYLKRSTNSIMTNFEQYNTVFPRSKYLESIYIDTLYYLYRFFSNGRLYRTSGLNHFPTIEDQNNFNKGMIGYYKIDEGEKITTEVFIPFDNGLYNIKYGYLKGDSIIFNEEYSNVFFGLTRDKIDIRLYKVKNHKVFLYSKPNW